ncbi:MAG: hypothetical protein NVV74_15615 [Magnetospirillum sp.]|nr:hypothetical protein [Magnetospirillum sp.]
MLSAPSMDQAFVPSPRTTGQWAPLALSALLHVLLALVWLGFPLPEGPSEQEPAIQVELAPEPAKPPASPPPAKPQAAAGPDSPIPQLEEGALAQRSSPPKPRESSLVPPAPRAEAAVRPRKPEPVTQNERDFVLGQVLRHWAPPKDLAGYAKGEVRVAVTVRADGYFDDIYDARRPWNPAAAFDGYTMLAADDIQRRTIDALLKAIRQAQPVKLPPALLAKAPFPVRLDFRFKDVR